MTPSTVLEKYSKTSKRSSHNVSNELTKSRTGDPKRKISIRHSMHEKGSNKDGGYRRMDMSGIEKVEMDEDKSEIRFLLQKMSHNK